MVFVSEVALASILEVEMEGEAANSRAHGVQIRLGCHSARTRKCTRKRQRISKMCTSFDRKGAALQNHKYCRDGEVERHR